MCRPDKNQLLAMIVICADLRQPLPHWAAQALRDAYNRARKGNLASWDDVFGKPFRGKAPKGSRTASREFEVWLAVRKLKRQHKPVGQALFEEVATNLKLGGKRGGESGWSTARRLYYQYEKRRVKLDE
jgi:hypothetical protein